MTNEDKSMTDLNYTPTRKHKMVLEYIKDNEAVLQPHVKDVFMRKFQYKNEESARQAIHQIICNLERKKLITVEKIRDADYIIPVKLLRAL